MRQAVDKALLQSIYDRMAGRYDAFHSFATLRSDVRGRRLVVAHGVQPGDRVLDAGGGTGLTSILAAEKVGPSGKVVVLDMSEGMLAQAKAKAKQANLSDRMSFQTGDMLKLPFQDESFDAVISTYSLCPLYDPQQGALELYRVVKPGGRLAAAHSGEPQQAMLRWLAQHFEDLIWRFPQLTLGCRPVSVLPTLQKAGATLLFERRIGFPLYPFAVFVVQKETA